MRKPVAPSAAPPAEAVKPHTLILAERLQVRAAGSGTAQARLSDSLPVQMQRWVQAAGGQPLPEIQQAVRAGKSPTIALSEYLNQTGTLTREQRHQVANFMEQAMKYGSVTESREQRWVGRNLIDVMTEGVKDKGITREQLELLANGDFSVQAYLSLVKDGQSIV